MPALQPRLLPAQDAGISARRPDHLARARVQAQAALALMPQQKQQAQPEPLPHRTRKE